MDKELFAYDLNRRNEEEIFDLLCSLVVAYDGDLTDSNDYTTALETWLIDPIDSMLEVLQDTLNGYFPNSCPVVICDSGWLFGKK